MTNVAAGAAAALTVSDIVAGCSYIINQSVSQSINESIIMLHLIYSCPGEHQRIRQQAWFETAFKVTETVRQTCTLTHFYIVLQVWATGAAALLAGSSRMARSAAQKCGAWTTTAKYWRGLAPPMLWWSEKKSLTWCATTHTVTYPIVPVAHM